MTRTSSIPNWDGLRHLADRRTNPLLLWPWAVGGVLATLGVGLTIAARRRVRAATTEPPTGTGQPPTGTGQPPTGPSGFRIPAEHKNQPGLGTCGTGHWWGYNWSEFEDGDLRTAIGGRCFEVGHPSTLSCPAGKVQARVQVWARGEGGAADEPLRIEHRCVTPARHDDGSLDPTPHVPPT